MADGSVQFTKKFNIYENVQNIIMGLVTDFIMLDKPGLDLERVTEVQ